MGKKATDTKTKTIVGKAKIDADRKKLEKAHMRTGMVNQAKAGIPEAIKAKEIYDNFPRFSEEKSRILDQWKKPNKPFKFINKYAQERAKETSSSSAGTCGYGTKQKT